MRPLTFDPHALRKHLLRHKIATLPELKGILGTTTDLTVFRKLKLLDYSAWVQDNYRVAPKLTLNLGFRYDIMTPFKEVRNRESFFNPTLPNPAVGGFNGALMFYGDGPDSCHCSTNINTYFKAVQPRIGLAYSINSKTVFRAGYDMTYTHRGAVGGRGGGWQLSGITTARRGGGWGVGRRELHGAKRGQLLCRPESELHG